MSHLRLVHSGEPAPAPVDTLSPERRRHLNLIVLKLPRDERLVTMAHFFENKPMGQVANELGISEVEARDLRERALRMLKTATAFG
jgi:DNA-directed RNA polymerase specialized sigma24 family protein